MRDYEKIVAREGATFFNDHIALRSIATEVLAMGFVAADRFCKLLQMKHPLSSGLPFLAPGEASTTMRSCTQPQTPPPPAATGVPTAATPQHSATTSHTSQQPSIFLLNSCQ